MMTIKPIKQKAIWEEFVAAYPGANFLQSWAWGEFQRSLDRSVWRLGIYERRRLTGAVQFYLEPAKRGTYLACPGGPLFDYQNSSHLPEFLKYLKPLSKKTKIWFFRCRPQLTDLAVYRQLFKHQGFTIAPMHLTADLTWELNLQTDLDTIMGNMRKTTRSAIRKAQKSGVTIKTSTDLKDIDKMFQLQLTTQKKHHFIGFSKHFWQKQMAAFLPDNQVLLFKAYVKSRLCAMAFILFYNHEAVYHYAAANELAYQNNASYLIQWEAIKEAKKRDCKTYNFWGIAPLNKPHHRYYGVTIFKRGFGGQEKAYLPAMDYPLSYNYLFTRGFELVRKKVRKL